MLESQYGNQTQYSATGPMMLIQKNHWIRGVRAENFSLRSIMNKSLIFTCLNFRRPLFLLYHLILRQFPGTFIISFN